MLGLWRPKTSAVGLSEYNERRIAKGHSSEGASRVRPLQDKPAGTCIAVFDKKRRIRALIDTGSDVTLAGTELARNIVGKFGHAN